MDNELTDIEKRVIAAIQEDIPIVERPYLKLAEHVGISERQVLQTVEGLVQRGVIRRLGATLRHQKSGYGANVMAAWQVDEARVLDIGNIMASFKAVSHCYRRDPTPRWPYNLYTMVHGHDAASCRKTVQKMAAKSGIAHYVLLFSRRELKKTSMKYFTRVQGAGCTDGHGKSLSDRQ